MPRESKENCIWAASNRKDDRVALYEQDPAHPGGQAFIAGHTPDHVYKTGAVNNALHAGLIVEVPEPPDEIEIDGEKKPNPYKPLETVSRFDERGADAPGGPTRLGRDFSERPELYPKTAQQRIDSERERRQVPAEIPSTATVPPAAEPERARAQK